MAIRGIGAESLAAIANIEKGRTIDLSQAARYQRGGSSGPRFLVEACASERELPDPLDLGSIKVACKGPEASSERTAAATAHGKRSVVALMSVATDIWFWRSHLPGRFLGASSEVLR